MHIGRGVSRARTAVVLALFGCVTCATWIALVDLGRVFEPLTGVLVLAALAANVAATQWDDKFVVDGSFIPWMLAVAFLGPAPAFVVAILAELGTWALERYRLPALPVNLLASAGPSTVAGMVFAELAPADELRPAFFLLLAGVACIALFINALIVASLIPATRGGSFVPRLKPFAKFVPAMAITVGMTVAIAAMYAKAGMGGALFMLFGAFAFTYMARLVVTARDRASKHAALSWGVLSGLIRSLDLRDRRASRHAAAVAAFARDIAQATGFRERECELAHTAGLLHDIGRFGLSDRVMERGRSLTEQDWETIRRHPEIGADMLRDFGLYGPVAEIVRAHHERIDGRGYPDGLPADKIPELAKIVAVAEVYDTLTADDTYRTPVSSFEALNELRRVSGTQLDGRYVEALAALLAGRGVEYRHADRASFDEELDVERRISDAAGVASSSAGIDEAASSSAGIDEAAGQ
jgi:putative nucleotidyltransferase with HDIG domain